MVDAEGRIQIPGYYDNVRELSESEREQWKQLPTDDQQFARAIGVDQLFGETGYTTDERRWARPTFDINGLTSGHQGEGVKTIIPATASAKISFRLVPDQDPKQLTTHCEQHLQVHAPDGIRWSLSPDHGAPGMLADTDSRFVHAASRAIESAFGVKPVLIREGGSIPIVTRFQEVLDAIVCCWDGGCPTTTPTAQTKNFASKTIIVASVPPPSSGMKSANSTNQFTTSCLIENSSSKIRISFAKTANDAASNAISIESCCWKPNVSKSCNLPRI